MVSSRRCELWLGRQPHEPKRWLFESDKRRKRRSGSCHLAAGRCRVQTTTGRALDGNSGSGVCDEQSSAYAFYDRTSTILSGQRRNWVSLHRQPGNGLLLRTAATAVRVPSAAERDREPKSRVVFSFLRFYPPIGKVIMPDVLDDPSLEKIDWRKHWRMLWRRRWWLALPAFGIWIAVWALAWFLPAVYRSETVILVEQQKVPEQYVVPNVSADLQDRLQNMTQQILSRTRLLNIMDDFNLYPKLRVRVTGDEMVERMRKDIQVELVQAVNRTGNLSAFKVAYLSNDPVLAQKVTAQLTSLFINENLKTRQEQSAQTTQFLANQLEEAGRGLAEQEAKVKEFKSQYLGQ